MTLRIIITTGIVAVAAFTRPLAAQEQSTAEHTEFVVDHKLADVGKKIFSARGCNGCHTIGKGDLAAPDLGGLLERRSEAWIKKWLHDPEPMLEKDDTAKALLKRYNSLRMPNLQLSDTQIVSLMHYIASQTRATRPGSSATQ